MVNLERIVKNGIIAGTTILTLLNPLKNLYSQDSANFFVEAKNKSNIPIEFVDVIAHNFNDRSIVYNVQTDGSGVAQFNNVQTPVIDNDNTHPKGFALEQNYPNPWNPSTTIDFVTERSGNTSLVVYNILGKKVKTIVDGNLPSGNHSVKWGGVDDKGNGVSAGVYIYRLSSGDNVESKKMVLSDGARSGIESTVTSVPFFNTPHLSKIQETGSVDDNVYILSLSKDGFKTINDTVSVEEGVTFSYVMDKELGKLSFRLVEPFGNSTDGVDIFDDEGRVVASSDSEGNVTIINAANYDTLSFGGNLFSGKLPVEMPDDGSDFDRGNLTVVMNDYPMKYLIKFSNGHIKSLDNPRNYAYVKAWHPDFVNADSTLKGVKYLNVPDEKLEDFVSMMANVNGNLRLAGSKHLYPMPDSTNLIYRIVNNQPEEATFADSLRNDSNTSIFYLCGKYILFPGSGTNGNGHNSVPYATKGDFNTGYWLPPDAFFEEALTTILNMNGEAQGDEMWLGTIFTSSNADRKLNRLVSYSGQDIYGEQLIVTPRDNLEPGTLLRPHVIIYTPKQEEK